VRNELELQVISKFRKNERWGPEFTNRIFLFWRTVMGSELKRSASKNLEVEENDRNWIGRASAGLVELSMIFGRD